MHDHDHVRAAKSSVYRELRIRVYETTSAVRLIVEAKPLNECYCTFVPVASHRMEKRLPDDNHHSVESIVWWTVEALVDAFPAIDL